MFLSFVSLCGFAQAADLSLPLTLNDMLMSDVSMVMTHDAATGYMEIPWYVKLSPISWAAMNELHAWTKTQTGGFAQQLDCGARAFDLRPSMKHPKSGKGPLVFCHGDVIVDKTVESAIDEIAEWMHNHNNEEVVLLHWSGCKGKNCEANLEQVLSAAAVKYNAPGLSLHRECKDLAAMTVRQTKEAFRSSTFGGTVLSYKDCVRENYREEIACYIDGGKCWGYDQDFAIMRKYWDHVKTILNERGDGFNMVQAHWQYGTESVVTGILHGGTILKDESLSELNQKFYDFLHKREVSWETLKIVEVDNVCDSGDKLATKLREITMLKQQDSCPSLDDVVHNTPEEERWNVWDCPNCDCGCEWDCGDGSEYPCCVKSLLDGMGRRRAELEAPSLATAFENLMTRLDRR